MSFVFFTDRDLGRQFPDILEANGILVERHRDHFADTAADEEWFTGSVVSVRVRLPPRVTCRCQVPAVCSGIELAVSPIRVR